MAGKAVHEAAGDSVRVFVGSFHRFGYPRAEAWDDFEVRSAYRWSDVVVVHNDATILDRIPARPDRQVVLHHHGSKFRGNPDIWWQEAERRGIGVQVVSTVDLLLSVPSGKRASWLPQVVDLEHMRWLRAEHYRQAPRIRICHAPTARAIKGTRIVQKAMRLVKAEADFYLVQHKPWTYCLQVKAASDIFVDQLRLGYGGNAVEAWAMGLPVVAAAPDDILRRMRREYRSQLPFYAADIEALQADLRALIHDPDLRAEYAKRGEAHVRRFHAPEPWLRRVRKLYAGEGLRAVA